jgi:hypothetical protein
MKKFAILMALVMLMGFVGSAQSAVVTVDDPMWYEFSFTAVGVQAQGAFPLDPLGLGVIPSSGGNSQLAPAPAWTFNSLVPVYVTVVDAFAEGDAFNVFDFGSSVGATSAVANTGNASGTSDPAVALGIPTLSRGFLFLPAGNHSLTFVPYQVVSNGAAYFKVSTSCPCPTPIPGSLLLLGTGVLGLVGIGLRKK